MVCPWEVAAPSKYKSGGKRHEPMKRYLTLTFPILCIVLAALSGCAPAVKCEAENCTRILFIGNSHTYVNELPMTFTALAASGKQPVETGMYAPGGWTLTQHAESNELWDLIRSTKWNYVVVQEQSQIPAAVESRAMTMYPAARTLVGRIRKVGATPLFFETWARRDGWPENAMPTYEIMQNQVKLGYAEIAHELLVRVVPAGDAWQSALKQDPSLALWQEDGIHPTEAGTYLAACVFYAVIFKESPEGLSYRGNLSKAIVQELQAVAAKKVMNSP